MLTDRCSITSNTPLGPSISLLAYLDHPCDYSTWLVYVLGYQCLSNFPPFRVVLMNLPSSQNIGWQAMIRVDNQTYQWLGASNVAPAVNLTNTQVTPTQTVFTFSAGPANLIVTFLSPIEVGRCFFFFRVASWFLVWYRGMIPSSNPYHSRILRWMSVSLMVCHIMCKFTWTSVEVCFPTVMNAERFLILCSILWRMDHGGHDRYDFLDYQYHRLILISPNTETRVFSLHRSK